MAVRCGAQVHKDLNAAAEAHHDSVAQVKLCYFSSHVLSHEEELAEDLADFNEAPWFDGDEAYERFLERPVEGEEIGADGCTDYERGMGCIGYFEARDRAAAEAAR